MANCCGFDMKVVGDKESLEKFDIEVNSTEWRVYSIDSYEINDNCIMYYGDCAWSIATAMAQKLKEFSEMYGVNIEVYSEEYGCCFNEHYLIVNGEIILDDCVEAYNILFNEDVTTNIREAIQFGAMLHKVYGDDIDWDCLEINDGEDVYYNKLDINWEI